VNQYKSEYVIECISMRAGNALNSATVDSNHLCSAAATCTVDVAGGFAAGPQSDGFTGSRRVRMRVSLITISAPASRSSATWPRFARMTAARDSARLSGAPEQDDAGRQNGCVGEEFTEVGVGGDEDPVLAVGQGHDLLVGPAAEAEFIDVRAVVARSSQ
jgi:hypothetical protein